MYVLNFDSYYVNVLTVKCARTGVIAVFLSSDTIHNSAVMKMDVAEIRSIYETINEKRPGSSVG